MTDHSDVFDNIDVKRDLGLERDQERKSYAVLSDKNKHALQRKVEFALKHSYMLQGGITSDNGVLYQAVVDVKTIHNPMGMQGDLLIEG